MFLPPCDLIEVVQELGAGFGFTDRHLRRPRHSRWFFYPRYNHLAVQPR